MAAEADLPALWLWRHPRPEGAAGRCIGRTDLPLHHRRAKRLAHRIRASARRHRLPHEVWTSPLRRCADVGRWLVRWGWQHHVDARLLELDFGAWDGQPWSAIAWSQVQAWEADFTGHAPGGGEALAAMAARLAHWLGDPGPAGAAPAAHPRLVVAHAGAMQLLQRVDGAGAARAAMLRAAQSGPAPLSLAERMCAGLDAAHWPRPPRYAELRRCPPVRA